MTRESAQKLPALGIPDLDHVVRASRRQQSPVEIAAAINATITAAPSLSTALSTLIATPVGPA